MTNQLLTTPIPGQLLLDKAEIVLRIPRKLAKPIYKKISKNWEQFNTKPRSVIPERHRYQYGYTVEVLEGHTIEVYTVPIGNGQSSIKIAFNPSQNAVSKLSPDTARQRIKAVRRYLKLILGERAYTIFGKAHFTRYDLAYDYVGVNLRDFHYYMKGPHGDNTAVDDIGEVVSYKIGANSSNYQVVYYNKSLDLFKKTGNAMWLETPITRVEFRIKKNLPFREIFTIDNPFERLTTFRFNHRDPSFQHNFIESASTNQHIRSRLIELLDEHTLFMVLRLSEGKVGAILNSLAPYRVHMYPTGLEWQKQRDNALSPLKLFRPSKKHSQKNK